MGIEVGNSIVRSDVQTIIDNIYTGRIARGLSNNTKPSLNTTKPLGAEIAIVISNIRNNSIGINYASSIIPSTIDSGTKLTSNGIKRFDQYRLDLLHLRTCASGCMDSCWKTCSGNGCSSSGCSGNCSSGCGNYCTSCSGSLAWGCINKCGFECSGTGSCKGNCQMTCTNGCSSACLSTCNTICTNECKNSCTSGCSNSHRIGVIDKV